METESGAGGGDEEDTDPEMPTLIPAPAVPAVVPPCPRERSNTELATMTKLRRRVYHEARLEASGKLYERPTTTRADRRAAQEAQRCAKGSQREQASGRPLSLLEAAAAELAFDDLEGADYSADPEDSEQADPIVSAGAAEECGEVFQRVERWLAGVGGAAPPSRRSLEDEAAPQAGAAPPPARLLAALLAALAHRACARLDLAEPRPQPSAVAARIRPVVGSCARVLEELWVATGGNLATAAATSAAREAAAEAAAQDAVGEGHLGAECAEVGFLMALRDELGCLEDAELCAACRCIQAPSRVMRGFIKFLEEESEDSSEDADCEAEEEDV